MAIVEFVHLLIPPPHTPSSPDFPALLRTCCTIMGRASGLPSIFLVDLLDETKMYVVGGWPSKEAHQGTLKNGREGSRGGDEERKFSGGFNGSAEQGKLIAEIDGRMDITWMEYLGISIDGSGRIGGSRIGSGEGGGLNVGSEKCVVAVVLDCGDLDSATASQSVRDRANVEDAVNQKFHLADDKVVSGWNVKKEEQQSETDYLLLFRGFDEVEEAKKWGEMVKKELENVNPVKTVTVVYMRRAEY